MRSIFIPPGASLGYCLWPQLFFFFFHWPQPSCLIFVHGASWLVPMSWPDFKETRTEVAHLLSVSCYTHAPTDLGNHIYSRATGKGKDAPKWGMNVILYGYLPVQMKLKELLESYMEIAVRIGRCPFRVHFLTLVFREIGTSWPSDLDRKIH